jgi:hypothetical protein
MKQKYCTNKKREIYVWDVKEKGMSEELCFLPLLLDVCKLFDTNLPE